MPAGRRRSIANFPATRPAGVVGQIIPWNFPLLMLAWKIAPALAAGCTVVLKPAEFTPLTAILFAEICERAGVPKGVVNILPGGPDAGAAIVNHAGVDKIAFTGSSEVGKIIRKATAGTGKKLSLELGGKSAFIVFEDADLDSAVEGLVDGIWFNQGQVCCAGSRLLVQEGIADAFIAKVKTRMSRLRVGSPLDKNTDIGPLVDRTQLDRVRGLVAEGARQGAECWQPDFALPSSGYFYLPTLATGVSPANILAQEEVFGPVLATMTFRTTEEAVELANNTRYGLAASVWSENLNLALHVAPQFKAGVVWVNGTNMFDAACGFGGYRESGFGREGGREGMFEYLAETLPLGPAIKPAAAAPRTAEPAEGGGTAIDRTAKLFIGGKQVRPDGNYSYRRARPQRPLVGEAGLGNRKDIRDAVAAARACKAWPEATGLQPQPGAVFPGRKSVDPRRRIRRASGRADRRRGQGRARRGRPVGRAAVRLRRHGRQVRGPRPPAAGPRRDAGAARAGRRARHRRPGRGAAAWPDLAGRAGARDGQHGGRGAVAEISAARHRSLPGDRIFRRAGRRHQHRDRQIGRTRRRAGQARRCRRALDRRRRRNLQGARPSSIGNLKRVWTAKGHTLDWQSEQFSGDSFLRRAIEVKNVWVPYGD